MAITQQEIADRLGVSRQLVGFALSGGGTISAAMREHIRAQARQLGYRPHGMARAMRSGRFGNVGLFVSTTNGTLSPVMLDALHDTLAARDVHLTIVRLSDDELGDDAALPRILREHMVDGMLLSYTAQVPPRVLGVIERHGVPCIWINNKREGDCVHPDDLEGARSATAHLLELGHRSIGYLHHLSNHYSSSDRLRGYEQAMREAGLEPHVYPFGDWATPPDLLADTNHDRLNWWLRLLERPDRSSAFVCYGDLLAVPLLMGALRLGLSVPEDLSVVVFHPEFVSTGIHALTTQRIPFEDMGKVAATMLLDKIEQPERVLPPRALPFRWYPGTTCARSATCAPFEPARRSP